MNRHCRIILSILITLVASLSSALADQDDSSPALGIYGNANMDDTIDEKDISYVQEVIQGTKPSNNLTDANYDGKIDQEDIAQIEMIMRGEEKNLTLVSQSNWDKYTAVTVHKPIKTVLVSRQQLSVVKYKTY